MIEPRSWLFVPADSEKKIAKALDSEADAIIFDLEDSVAQALKQVARDVLKNLPRRDGGPLWWVRVNPLGSEHHKDDLELIRLAGKLHDLGKLAIPEEILRKRGTLTPREREVLERHPQIGENMLDPLGIEPVATWVLHHHERWDGDGYPGNLAGERIPIGARIIFAADSFDAMTSERVYRSALSFDEATEELRRCSGSQFDPVVVVALLEELENPSRRLTIVANDEDAVHHPSIAAAGGDSR